MNNNLSKCSMSLNRYFLITAALFFCYSCVDKNVREEKIYYPNQKLKTVISRQVGKQEGVATFFYQSGRIRSKISWHDDLQHGPAIFYYPNGQLKERSNWMNNKPEGISQLYFSNGAMKRQSHFHNGTLTDSTILYNNFGKPVELHIYDKLGRLVVVTGYDKYNKPLSGGETPFIHARDTIRQGEYYSGYIDFGYPLNGNAKLIIGSMTKNLTVTDTFSIINQDTNGRFFFRYKPIGLGTNVFPYQFVYVIGKGKSSELIKFGEFHRFYVVPKKAVVY